MSTYKTKISLMMWLMSSFLNIYFYSQNADLTMNYLNVQNNYLKKGSLLKAQVSIKNIGTQTSNACRVAFWLSTTTSLSNANYLTCVSIPTIAVNGTYTFDFIYPVIYSVNPGGNYLLVYIDYFNSVNESNESNNFFYYPTLIQIYNLSSQTIHLPYPVLLVHGLSSNDQTWSNFKNDIKNNLGWNYGGVLNFCLNQDGNTSTALFSSDFMDYTNVAQLDTGDFYAINFDTDNTGTPYGTNVQSNQSAIYKQGYAIRNAVQHIMQKTGRNKVILLGHSMGGLASREYVQNPAKYQPDNQHHIAKIITLGTPHGGSNAGPTFSPLTPDGQSEAVRDLRTTYYYSNNPGVFLFGGVENLSYMDDQLCCYFYNADVNCNGITGEWIIGLNQKPFPNNINIVCNIGDGDILGGDGVVNTTSADINNYLNLNADTFILMKTGLMTWHIELTKQTKPILRSFDEPNNKSYAFEINDSTHYFGLLNLPSRRSSSSNIDIDYYKLNLNQGMLYLKVYDIPTYNFTVTIQNNAGSSLYSFPSNGKSQIVQNISIPSTGTYYLMISGIANPDTIFTQYSLYYTQTITTNIEQNPIYEEVYINVYPNPANDYIMIDYDEQIFPDPQYQIYSIDGKLCIRGNLKVKEKIDINNLDNGMYLLTMKDNHDVIRTKKFIISH